MPLEEQGEAVALFAIVVAHCSEERMGKCNSGQWVFTSSDLAIIGSFLDENVEVLMHDSRDRLARGLIGVTEIHTVGRSDQCAHHQVEIVAALWVDIPVRGYEHTVFVASLRPSS
ncbi:MAG: hypothetical protein JSC189_000793 [Candidatus Tokpelaia sp. JSC189]|nr:MAG: hypothetical protein JSC189_000793 [Candidatus Tokpelaia sp. JSC189]